MWRMALFIRHNCGERKNTVGHCWTKLYSSLSQPTGFDPATGRGEFQMGLGPRLLG